MTRRQRHLARRRAGSVTIMMVFALVVVLGMGAFALDIGMVKLAQGQLQDVADAGALAAAAALKYGVNAAEARQSAIDVAAQNNVLGKPVTMTANDVVVGAWDSTTKTVVPWSPAFTTAAVQVTARRTANSADGPVNLAFAYIFGLQTTNLTATATSSIGVRYTQRNPLKIIVIQDASGSFNTEFSQAVSGDWAMYKLINTVAVSNDQVGYVSFSDEIRTRRVRKYNYYYHQYYYEYIPVVMTFTDLVKGDNLPTGISNFQSTATAVGGSGNTRPSVAIDWAIEQFDTVTTPDCDKVIVLVSDGMPYGGTTYLNNLYRQECVTAVDQAAAMGVRIHTVTLTDETQTTYGQGGADYVFNESLVRNGGYSFRTNDAQRLSDVLVAVGTLEVGKPQLMD